MKRSVSGTVVRTLLRVGQGAGQIGGGSRLCHREKEDVWVGRSKGQGLEAETWEVCFGDPGLTVEK